MPTLGTEWNWNPPDPPCTYGSRVAGPALPCTGQRSPLVPAFSGPAHCTPRNSARFFPRIQEILCFSLPLPLRGISEEIQAGVSSEQGHSLSRARSLLPERCPAPGAQHLETRRGGGGCGHRAAYEGVPLALHSCGAPAVVAGGGLTLVNRAALPPAPSSPPPCSSPPTSPAMTRNGLGPPCVSCTTEWGGEGQDPHERLIWSSCPPPTSCEPWQKASPAGRRPPRGSTHCEVACVQQSPTTPGGGHGAVSSPT